MYSSSQFGSPNHRISNSMHYSQYLNQQPIMNYKYPLNIATSVPVNISPTPLIIKSPTQQQSPPKPVVVQAQDNAQPDNNISTKKFEQWSSLKSEYDVAGFKSPINQTVQKSDEGTHYQQNLRITDEYSRLSFIQATFLILFVQSFVDTILCMCAVYHPHFRHFLLDNHELNFLIISLFIFTIISLIYLHPLLRNSNVIIGIVIVMTICIGQLLSLLCSLGFNSMLMIVFSFMAIFGAYTLYAFYTKEELKTVEVLKWTVIATLFVSIIFLIFSDIKVGHSLLITVIMLFFCLFIIMDMHMITGFKSQRYLITDYWLVSQEIWIDILIFPYRILEFIVQRNKEIFEEDSKTIKQDNAVTDNDQENKN